MSRWWHITFCTVWGVTALVLLFSGNPLWWVFAAFGVIRIALAVADLSGWLDD